MYANTSAVNLLIYVYFLGSYYKVYVWSLNSLIIVFLRNVRALFAVSQSSYLSNFFFSEIREDGYYYNSLLPF